MKRLNKLEEWSVGPCRHREVWFSPWTRQRPLWREHGELQGKNGWNWFREASRGKFGTSKDLSAIVLDSGLVHKVTECSYNRLHPFREYLELLLHGCIPVWKSDPVTEIDTLVLKHWKDMENQQIFRIICDSIEWY